MNTSAKQPLSAEDERSVIIQLEAEICPMTLRVLNASGDNKTYPCSTGWTNTLLDLGLIEYSILNTRVGVSALYFVSCDDSRVFSYNCVASGNH